MTLGIVLIRIESMVRAWKRIRFGSLSLRRVVSVLGKDGFQFMAKSAKRCLCKKMKRG